MFGKLFSTRKYFSVGEREWGGGGGGDEGVDGQSLSHNTIGDPCKNLCKKLHFTNWQKSILGHKRYLTTKDALHIEQKNINLQ